MRTYFKFLSRNKLYTFVTVFGFSVSLMFVILLGFYVQGELSVDNFHSKGDRIYMLRSELHACLSNPAPAYVQELVPEVEAYCRIANADLYIETTDGEKIKTSILLVDSTFFTIFDFKLRTGQPDDVLSLRRSIVLTPETARRFFGNDDPKGRILHDKLTVSGIMEPIPFYSQFPQVDAVVSYDYIEELFGSELLSGWGYFQFSAYFLMKPHTNIQAKAKVLEKIFTGEESPLGLWRSGYAKEVHFVPLKKCYYDPLVITSRFDIRKNDASKVYILLAIVLLILFIAILNYINLTVAQAGFRGKEAAVRRLLGESQKGLIRRYLGESFLITFISFLLGLLLAFMLEPFFDRVLDTRINLISRFTYQTIIVIVSSIVILSFASGLLPSIVISHFKPIEVVKGYFSYRIKSNYSHFLVILQYTVSLILVTCSLIILMQSHFLIHTDLGFRTHGIMLISNNLDSVPQESLRNEIQKIPGVDMVSFSSGNPVNIANNVAFNDDGERAQFTWEMMIDSLFFDFFEIKPKYITQEPREVLFNGDRFRKTHLMPSWATASMVNVVHPDPNTHEFTRGSYKQYDGLTHVMVGILPEIKYRPLNESQDPLLIYPLQRGQYPWTTMVRVRDSIDRKAVEKTILETYKRIGNVDDVKWHWAEDIILDRYKSQTNLSQLISAFALLTVLIMVMGVFAMSLYMIKQKEKEIALRKVNGATVATILAMLNIRSLRRFGIALLVALPVSWWAMDRWLQTFAFHIRLDWWVFVVAALIVLLLSLVSTSLQSWRAACANPVDYLKNE